MKGKKENERMVRQTMNPAGIKLQGKLIKARDRQGENNLFYNKEMRI